MVIVLQGSAFVVLSRKFFFVKVQDNVRFDKLALLVKYVLYW
jgi:hypothetical protein